MAYITETGFNKKTLSEIKEELESDFKNIFGDDIDLEPDGPFGQMIGILSKRDADIWDGMEEFYTSRNPNQATGISLDNIVVENAIERLPATATQAKDVQLLGSEGTIIEAGKLARQNNTTIDYSLDETVTITKTVANRGLISVSNIVIGNTYTIIIDSVNYDYIAQVGDDELDILTELEILINVGWTGSTVIDTIENTLLLEDIGNDFSFDIVGDLEILEIWSRGDFSCISIGANSLPANTLQIIQTPVSGWDEINNYNSGIIGRNRETDIELRIRREKSIIRGSGTELAINAAIIDEVENVTNSRVISNRTLVTDVDGRPAKSFECVVEGGLDDEIGNVIWQNQPAGIESYGNTTVIIVDSQGKNQTIKFSRPELVYIHVKVKRNYNTEETYPANGDDLIKQNILEWAENINNINIGVDVIRQKLSIPIYMVSGIKDIEITIDGTPNPGDTPTYLEQNIAINDREIANFAENRIVVEDLP